MSWFLNRLHSRRHTPAPLAVKQIIPIFISVSFVSCLITDIKQYIGKSFLLQCLFLKFPLTLCDKASYLAAFLGCQAPPSSLHDLCVQPQFLGNLKFKLVLRTQVMRIKSLILLRLSHVGSCSFLAVTK